MVRRCDHAVSRQFSQSQLAPHTICVFEGEVVDAVGIRDRFHRLEAREAAEVWVVFLTEIHAERVMAPCAFDAPQTVPSKWFTSTANTRVAAQDRPPARPRERVFQASDRRIARTKGRNRPRPSMNHSPSCNVANHNKPSHDFP